MARRIELEVEGVTALAELNDDLSPRACDAFWHALPMHARMTASKWSGRAGRFHPDAGLLGEVQELENPVCSIYPGTVVVRPKGEEILIGIGQAEYRRHVGTEYVSRLAHIVQNRPAFLQMLGRLRDEGAKHITIRQAGA